MINFRGKQLRRQLQGVKQLQLEYSMPLMATILLACLVVSLEVSLDRQANLQVMAIQAIQAIQATMATATRRKTLVVNVASRSWKVI